jgi:IS5 family transposase
MWAMNQLRQIVLSLLDVAQDAYGAIDSLPVPVVQFHLAPQRSRDWDAYGATFGQCASKKQTFFGYRLHLIVTLGGVILDFALTGATADERDVAEELLPALSGRTFLGDKGYVKAALAAWLQEQGVRLIALRRANQHVQLPATLTRLIKRFRQIIETVNGQLGEQFAIEQNYAHSTSTISRRGCGRRASRFRPRWSSALPPSPCWTMCASTPSICWRSPPTPQRRGAALPGRRSR